MIEGRNLQVIAKNVYQILKEQGLGHREVISLLAILAGTVTQDIKNP